MGFLFFFGTSASSAFVLKIGLCPSFRTLKRASSGARDGIWIASPGEQTNSDGESSSSEHESKSKDINNAALSFFIVCLRYSF